MVKTDTDSALARAFLSGQSVDESKIAEYVSAVDRQIRAATQSSITEAVALADTFLVRSIALSPQLRLVAFRSAGWAYLVAGKYQKSKTAYLSARRLSGGDLLTRGRIDRTLIDVYMYLGNSAEATRRARMAMTAFRRIDSPDDLARAHVNYANLLHRQDRHRQAHKLYHQAGEHFAAKGDDLSAALAWYNEANTLVQLFDFKQAELLYAKAKQIFDTREYRLHATGCLYGEAWLNMLAGNFHIALRDLSACETFYTAGGMQRELVLCQLDRAESYLGLNLCLDARREAEAALVTAKKLKITYEQGKAYFFAGRAAVGLGRSGEARRLFQQASTIFHRENNAGFYRAVIFDRAQLATVKSARRKQKLTASKSESAQLPLWSAIRDIQLAFVGRHGEHPTTLLSGLPCSFYFSRSSLNLQNCLRRCARHPEERTIVAHAQIVRQRIFAEIEICFNRTLLDIQNRNAVARFLARAGDGDISKAPILGNRNLMRAFANGQRREACKSSCVNKRCAVFCVASDDQDLRVYAQRHHERE